MSPGLRGRVGNEDIGHQNRLLGYRLKRYRLGLCPAPGDAPISGEVFIGESGDVGAQYVIVFFVGAQIKMRLEDHPAERGEGFAAVG